ncbi:MAG TPA: hypothetical protein VD886_04455 [Herpetosiphonaceae bacterium]|nr:hypothetical protein [Herpetosiphonaceae bacterium]
MPQHSLYILDGAGNPIPCDHVFTWRQWFDATDRTLAKDTLPSGTIVRTAFLSLNHAFRPGPPILWETVVEGGPNPIVARYSSRTDAIDGHQFITNTIMRAEAALAARARSGEHAPGGQPILVAADEAG